METAPQTAPDQTALELPTITVLAVGLPEAVERRLHDSGRCALVHEPATAGEVAVVAVSTRMPRTEIRQALGRLGGASDAPVVAVVHAGGEALAAEVMRSGGAAVIAEGNEQALAAFVSGEAHDCGLVESYEQMVTSSRGRTDSRYGRDHTTHLPGRSTFDQRLAELCEAGGIPRIGFVRVLNLVDLSQRLSHEAVVLLRRRLAVQFRHMAQLYDVELFALSDTDFALVSSTLSPSPAEQLGRQMARVTGNFAPTGVDTLGLAMGHAGPEVGQDPKRLAELAHRALEVAASEEAGAVVSADTLSLDGSSTTELETATRILGLVEHHGRFPPGHGARVAAHVGEIARALGYEGTARTRLQLAAHLHDVGMIGLPAEAVAGPQGLSGAALEAYRQHPARGADYLRVSAGADVAAAVRSHHERWDGDGFPDGLRGDDIPVGARMIAVADAFEEALHGGARGVDQSVPGVEEALAALRELAGTRLDPELVDVAATVPPPLAADLAPAELG